MAVDSERYRALVDNLPDGMLRGMPVYEEGRVVDFVLEDANLALAHVLGKPQSQLRGRTVSAVVPGLKETGGSWIEPYARVALDGKPVVVERLAGFLGRWYEVSIFRDDTGVVTAVFHDVTEHKKVGEALRKSEQRYRSLFEHSLDAVYVIAVDGSGVEPNQAWLDLFGYTRDELARLNAVDFYADPHGREDFLRRMAEHGRVQDVIQLKRRDGTLFDCERSVAALKDESGVVTHFEGLHRDITNRKRAEQALRDSEAAARALLDGTSDAACLIDPRGTILSLNEEMGRRLHGVPAALVGECIWEHMAPDVARGRKAKVEEVVRLHRNVRFEDERDGRRIETSMSPILDARGEVVRLAVLGRDVTEERRAEQQLRDSREELRSLAARQQEAREQERLGIARELHDQLGQYLTVLKIDLHRARKQTASGSPPDIDSFTSMIEMVNQMAEDVRRISSELRPGVLDDFGLVAAMEWQVSQFRTHTGILCELETTVDDSDFDRERSTALFRVFQELLTNVARHARARNVSVALTRDDARYVLMVSDDGRGITRAQEESHMSLGLIGMRERVRPFGGRVEFERRATGGTIARAILPAGQVGEEDES